jgi:hypothetical protein
MNDDLWWVLDVGMESDYEGYFGQNPDLVGGCKLGIMVLIDGYCPIMLMVECLIELGLVLEEIW